MSDDFDKEAERERLREKYEADQEDRAVTERMSQLLLQGATMTNKHCDTCGSPLFRYDGQTFCPTCQAEADGAADPQEAAAQGEGETAAGQPQAAEGEGQTAEASSQQPGGGPEAPTTEQDAEQEGAGPDSAQAGDQTATRPEQSRTGTGPAQSGGQPSRMRGAGQGARQGPGQTPEAGSLDDAQAALVRTLTSLARRAEQTEDPRQAKELLSAAREAAETLSRLRRN